MMKMILTTFITLLNLISKKTTVYIMDLLKIYIFCNRDYKRKTSSKMTSLLVA